MSSNSLVKKCLATLWRNAIATILLDSTNSPQYLFNNGDPPALGINKTRISRKNGSSELVKLAVHTLFRGDVRSMGTDDMPLVLRKRLEEALKSRIDLLKDSHENNVLIQLPKRFNVNVFEDEQLYNLVEAMIRARADELLKDANAMQSIINEIDVASERKLSGLVYKYQQEEWSRQESDKLRLLWAYFQRPKGQFSHSTSLNRLRMLHEAFTSDAPCSILSTGNTNSVQPSVSALDALPDLPSDECPTPESETSADLAAAPLGDAASSSLNAPLASNVEHAPLADLPSAVPAPLVSPAAIISLDSDDERTETQLHGAPAHAPGVAAMLQRKYEEGRKGVDHVAHKHAFQVKRRPAAAKVLAKPAAAGAVVAAAAPVLARPAAAEAVVVAAPAKAPTGVNDIVAAGPAAATAPRRDERKRNTVTVESWDPPSGSFKLDDYPLRQSDDFQSNLLKGAEALDKSYGYRGFKSLLVCSWQRETWVFQVKDSVSKLVVVQTSDRQFGTKQQACLIGMVLLALYDAGADKEALQNLKTTGVFGVKCGKASKSAHHEE